jgi:hypothetical protein
MQQLATAFELSFNSLLACSAGTNPEDTPGLKDMGLSEREMKDLIAELEDR